MPDPHLRMMEMDLRDTLPSEVEQIAAVASGIVLEDITKGRVAFLVLLTFTARKARLWQLHDVPDPDEVVRAIAEREEAEAIAFVYPMPLPPEVEQGDRGYNIAIEAPSGKFDQLAALWGGEGPGGDWVRLYGRRVGDVGHRWLGVPPSGEVLMWFQGVVGAVGPVIGEA